MKRVEMLVGGEEVRRIACAQAVGEFGKRVAVTEKRILHLRVVNGRKGVKIGLGVRWGRGRGRGLSAGRA